MKVHESFSEQLARVEMMTEDEGGESWDLSENDRLALRAVLDALKRASSPAAHAERPDLAESIIEKLSGCVEQWAVSSEELHGIVRAALSERAPETPR